MDLRVFDFFAESFFLFFLFIFFFFFQNICIQSNEKRSCCGVVVAATGLVAFGGSKVDFLIKSMVGSMVTKLAALALNLSPAARPEAAVLAGA